MEYDAIVLESYEDINMTTVTVLLKMGIIIES